MYRHHLTLSHSCYTTNVAAALLISRTDVKLYAVHAK